MEAHVFREYFGASFEAGGSQNFSVFRDESWIQEAAAAPVEEGSI